MHKDMLINLNKNLRMRPGKLKKINEEFSYKLMIIATYRSVFINTLSILSNRYNEISHKCA